MWLLSLPSIDVNTVDAEGRSFIQIIIWRASYELLHDILKASKKASHSINFFHKDNDNLTIFHYLCYTTGNDAVEKFNTLLVQFKDSQSLVSLLNSQDRQGQTAIHTAVYFHQYELIKRLLKHGADPDIKAAIPK